MTIPTITLQLDPFFTAASIGPLSFLITFFQQGGWIFFLILFFYFLYKGTVIFWMGRQQGKYFATWEFVCLAIDVPRFNEQGPQAVENIFSVLSGAHSEPNFKEKWWLGKIQEWFSFEIVSIEGYVQFLVRTPKHFRDLVETAIYSQYPHALISEIEDYSSQAPDIFPDDTYDIWGTELMLVKDQAYPIRNFEYFTDLFQEPGTKKFTDPMTSMMEVLTKIGPGEQIWFQIILLPVNTDWKKGSDKVVRKLLGRKEQKKKKLFIGEISEFVHELYRQITGFLTSTEKPADSKSDLSPLERDIVERIERKASKIGFLSTLRFIYMAKPGIMRKALAVSGFFGAIKQFNTIHLNAFKPRKLTATKAGYFAKYIVPGRQKRIMANYKSRMPSTMPYILNIEELATLFHFPSAEIRNPMVRSADLKRVAAPIILPVENDTEEFLLEELRLPDDKKISHTSLQKEPEELIAPEISPPPNLPIE